MYSTVITRTRVHFSNMVRPRRRDRLQRIYVESTASSQSKVGQLLQSIKVKASSLIEEETAHVPSFQNSEEKERREDAITKLSLSA